MTPAERRACASLAAIYGLRLLGLFVILPVFALYAEHLPGGNNLTLVGAAIGAYGLTQAILQIPFGWLSDRWGRKPVICGGLLLFAAGSFVAAAGTDIWMVILGRVLQGAGAISAAVVALLADLTRDEMRTRAMALIGSMIGLTFALSLIVSPWLSGAIGVPGIFAMTGAFALAAILVVVFIVPAVPDAYAGPVRRAPPRFREVLLDRELLRANWGVFVVHAILMALFIAVPLGLRDAGLPPAAHWQVYLPVMVVSIVLMVPAIFALERRHIVKPVFLGSVAALLASLVALPWLLGSVNRTIAFLIVFFTAFNIVEAVLPSLISRLAPAGAKGAAIGVYSSVQFLGTFAGSVAGGFLFERHGVAGLTALLALLAGSWLLAAAGMRAPAVTETRRYPLASATEHTWPMLTAALEALPGVHEALISEAEGVAYLKVDATRFDEQNVFKLIGGNA
jgi:MFS family permease